MPLRLKTNIYPKKKRFLMFKYVYRISIQFLLACKKLFSLFIFNFNWAYFNPYVNKYNLPIRNFFFFFFKYHKILRYYHALFFFFFFIASGY